MTTAGPRRALATQHEMPKPSNRADKAGRLGQARQPGMRLAVGRTERRPRSRAASRITARSRRARRNRASAAESAARSENAATGPPRRPGPRQIGDQVLRRSRPDAEPDQAVGNPHAAALFGRHAVVGRSARLARSGFQRRRCSGRWRRSTRPRRWPGRPPRHAARTSTRPRTPRICRSASAWSGWPGSPDDGARHGRWARRSRHRQPGWRCWAMRSGKVVRPRSRGRGAERMRFGAAGLLQRGRTCRVSFAAPTTARRSGRHGQRDLEALCSSRSAPSAERAAGSAAAEGAIDHQRRARLLGRGRQARRCRRTRTQPAGRSGVSRTRIFVRGPRQAATASGSSNGAQRTATPSARRRPR